MSSYVFGYGIWALGYLLYFYFVQFERTAACAKPPGRGVGEKDAIYKGRVRFPFIKGGGYKLIRPAAANTRLVTNNTNPSVLATKNLCQVRSCGRHFAATTA
jgi:hypothetical protein